MMQVVLVETEMDVAEPAVDGEGGSAVDPTTTGTGGSDDYYVGINPESPTLKADLTQLLFPRLTKISYSQVWKAPTTDMSFSLRHAHGHHRMLLPTQYYRHHYHCR